MAKEVVEVAKVEGQDPEPPKPSARERYRSRYQEAHPELDLDNEDEFYAQANQNLDDLESFRKTNKELGEAMDRTPVFAGMVLAARNGQNPFAWLAENIGPDMDIRELANNPEFAKTMGEALTKFMENQEAAKKKREEIGNNAVKSLQTLKELQQERGMTDEQCVKMANDFFGEFDADGNPVGKESFMYKASNGIVTKGMWESLINGRNYDTDIAAAREQASASALNQKIQNGLKSFGTDVPSLSAGGKGGGERKPKKTGGFADWGKDGEV